MQADRLEAVLQVRSGAGLLAFEGARNVIEARQPSEVTAAVRAVEESVRIHGHHAVGFFSYEAGAAYGLPVHRPVPGEPLVWFALFSSAREIRLADLRRGQGYTIDRLTPSLTRESFKTKLEQIKTHLGDGDTYQVNFTFALEGRFAGQPIDLFCDLVERQQSRFGAFIRSPERTICSASPELFFSKTGDEILLRPMKGTAQRGRTAGEDEALAAALSSSPKQRAENVMIVDMVRNDVGRVAAVGSVEALHLCNVERYPTVMQMTSDVRAHVTAPLDAVFEAMHPAASITGAPKHRTMEIIRMLEDGPRGIYTGAIGYIAPDGTAQFNVAIRTAVIDERRQSVRYGIGSGVVWDSVADDEYDECLLKAKTIEMPPGGFELVETMLWRPAGGVFLLERHLGRLAESAAFFGFMYSRERIEDALRRSCSSLAGETRVRMLLAADGEARFECTPITSNHDPVPVRLASQPVDDTDPLLFHKTTSRPQYREALTTTDAELLFWNARGEITETAIANIVVWIDGRLCTPPVASGILPGTFRARLLDIGSIHERRISVDEFVQARDYWLINSVRGWRRGQSYTRPSGAQ